MISYLCAIWLALGFTLSWTAPALRVDGGPVNCPLTWTVYQLQPQSATWRADSAAFRSDFLAHRATTVERDMPAIRAEDAPQQVRSSAWLLSQVGAPLSVTLPDSMAGSEFIVLHRNTGGWSAWSNIVRRP